MSKNKLSIEQQVAQLTYEQQSKILKIGKTALAVQLIGAIPMMLLIFLGLFTFIDPPAGMDYATFDKAFKGWIILLVLCVVYVFAVLAFVMVKYPYYSDEKYRYIKKMRKMR